ncbi:MAG TPA: hypothetical protein VLS91_06505 [Acidimicrobiales bacterium]|nr:hypothetical protein [Acidimicrobiales bacterium]
MARRRRARGNAHRGIATPSDPRRVVRLDDEPPIMWPAEGSGFEADPFSPSGMAQQEWVLASHLGKRRGGKVVIWIVLVLIVASLLSPLLNIVR